MSHVPGRHDADLHHEDAALVAAGFVVVPLDPQFEAAKAAFEQARIAFGEELLLHITKLVRQDFPTATLIATDGEDGNDGDGTLVRLQEVHDGSTTALWLLAEDEDAFPNLDEIDEKLTWLGKLSGDDFDGWLETPLPAE